MQLPRCLIISVSGIGNTILQTPLIRAIVSSNAFEVDCLFGTHGMKNVLEGLGGIKEQFVIPKGSWGKIHLLMALASRHYYATIACFPSNRPHFHILPWFLMAKKRIIHDYAPYNAAFSWLSNTRIPAKKGLHDVEQNLALLKGLGLPDNHRPKGLYFGQTSKHMEKANKFLYDLGIVGQDVRLLGLHAGAGPIKEKKWAPERFAEVARRLLKDRVFHYCLVFGGPDEGAEKAQIVSMIGTNKAFPVDAPLGVTGVLIKRSTFFLSNDTGLMHVAAALNKRLLAIFGPTDWTRTAPRSPQASFITPNLDKIKCAPCLRYPLEATRPTIKCKKGRECLKSISVDQVIQKIHSLMEQTL